MTGPLGWTVDENGGLAEVAVLGPLDPAAVPRFRTALLICLAEQPDALIVDLAAIELGDDTAVASLTVVARLTACWPGTPMLVCGPSPLVARQLAGGRRGRVAICPDVAAGRRAAADGRTAVPSLGDQLLPIAGAVRRARNMVTEACLAWELPELVGPGSLVASELVSNAVEHAHTMITIQVARRARHVEISVRDGSAAEPVIDRSDGRLTERGRGLLLVAAESDDWGWLPTRDGKVVWASLRE